MSRPISDEFALCTEHRRPVGRRPPDRLPYLHAPDTIARVQFWRGRLVLAAVLVAVPLAAAAGGSLAAPASATTSPCLIAVGLEPGLYESVNIHVTANGGGTCTISSATIYVNGVEDDTVAVTLGAYEGTSVLLAPGPNLLDVAFDDGEQWTATVEPGPTDPGPPTPPRITSNTSARAAASSAAVAAPSRSSAQLERSSAASSRTGQSSRAPELTPGDRPATSTTATPPIQALAPTPSPTATAVPGLSSVAAPVAKIASATSAHIWSPANFLVIAALTVLATGGAIYLRRRLRKSR